MIIDAHSHFGKDFYCGKINIEDYIECCKEIGVTTGFLMPSPWPIINKNGIETVSLIWEHQNYINRYYYKIQNGKKINVIKNPYCDVNYIYFNELKKNTEIDLRFIPLLHATLDEADYLEKMLNDIKPPAIKIHNFASGFSIENINMELMEVIKHNNIPLIIHTSVYNYDYGYGASTRFFRNECHPYKWAKFLIDNNLKGVLNHGACLNLDAINLVNNNENLMIGIGPDLDISKDFFKVDINKEAYFKSSYLKFLKQMVSANKLLFDIDFNWNINDDIYDIEQIKRYKSIWKNSELEDILYKNAINFFKLDSSNLIMKKKK